MSEPDTLLWLIPLGFAVFFPTLWLAVTALLGALSGWYGLMARYPDRDDPALAAFRWQSGFMGAGVRMNGVLNLFPCRGGLRVGMLRLLGPFCRPFYVPWRDLRVERRQRLFGPRAVLRFGEASRLEISADLADRLAKAAAGAWPEAR